MATPANINFSPPLKRMLAVVAVINAVAGIRQIIESFSSLNIYKKDFVQEYLMAKAILAGSNPYLPLPELARTYLNIQDYKYLDHPTPHLPIVGLLSLPLGYLSYEKAALVWLVVELVCLLASVLLLLRWWGAPLKAGRVAVLFALALGWAPVKEELWFGQFNSCLLLLLLLAWLALRSEKQALGGALLGGLIALKLTAWPVALFLMLRRKWESVIAAGVVVALAHVVSIAVLGFDCVKDYYLKVSPLVAAIYRSHGYNYSAWTWGERLFAGYGYLSGGQGYYFWVLPLWPSTTLAQLCAYAAPLAVLICGLWLALRARSFDTAFALLVGVGILVSPVAWPHYLMFAVIPLVIIARRLWTQGLPRKTSYLSLGLFLPLSVTQWFYVVIATLFVSRTTPEGIPIIPFAAGTLMLIPIAASISLLWLVWRWDDAELPLSSVFATSTVLAEGRSGVTV